jgi:hypothetical protein
MKNMVVDGELNLDLDYSKEFTYENKKASKSTLLWYQQQQQQQQQSKCMLY